MPKLIDYKNLPFNDPEKCNNPTYDEALKLRQYLKSIDPQGGGGQRLTESEWDGNNTPNFEAAGRLVDEFKTKFSAWKASASCHKLNSELTQKLTTLRENIAKKLSQGKTTIAYGDLPPTGVKVKCFPSPWNKASTVKGILRWADPNKNAQLTLNESKLSESEFKLLQGYVEQVKSLYVKSDGACDEKNTSRIDELTSKIRQTIKPD